MQVLNLKFLKIYFNFIIVFSCLFPGKANASNENELITRYAIFPISVEKAYLQEADDSWWNLRKEFLKSKLYLVSSKKFMQQKGVFQPRQSLEAADVIILARLLDAHALVITNLKDRNLSMIVYQGNTGKPLWQSQFELNAAIPIKRQLNEAVLNLMNSYLADIPYQGYVIKDDLIGKVLYEEDGKKYVKVNVGASTQISEGEKIQFFELESVNAKNLYQGGSQIKVFAEGVVSSINEQVAKVQVKRMGKDLDMSTGTLVRAPNEFARVKAQLKNFDQLKMEVNPYISEVKMREDSEEDEGNLVSALVFIGGIVGFLTIAF